MSRWIKWLIALVVVVGALLLASGLVIRSLVSGSAKDQLVKTLSDRMGAPITVAAVDFELGSWFLLRPTVALDDVTVGNPPGFSDKHLFEAKKIAAQVALGALLHKSIEVRSIAVNEPHIVVETDAHGLTNAGALISKLASGSSNGSTAVLAIDDLSITSGTLAVAGARAANINDIDLQLHDFSGDRRCHLEASAKLFGGKNSSFKLDAQVGPFTAGSLPLDGTLTLLISLAEIPAAIRREQFGNILGAPGSKASASMEAALKGDVYSTLAGPAKLVFTNISLGKDAAHVMAFAGEAAGALSVQNAMGDSILAIKIPDAKLKLGKGDLTGSTELQWQNSTGGGNVRGSIHNVEVNQLVSSFTTANEKIQGALSVPSFELQFAGKNAEIAKNSLHGTAKFQVRDGRIGALDMMTTLEHAMGQSQQTTSGAKGTTPFESFSADLKIGQQKIEVSNLVLTGAALKAEGSGTIGFDQSLHLQLTAHVGGTVARLVNSATLHIPSAQADIPVTVTGTVEAPQVHPALTKMIGSGVKGILNGFLKRKSK